MHTKGTSHIAVRTRRPWLISHKIYHPNVDLEGNVCLNILREDWKPVLNLNSVMVGLQYLFLEPNADDPLNKGKFVHLIILILIKLFYRSGTWDEQESRPILAECQAIYARGTYQGCPLWQRTLAMSFFSIPSSLPSLLSFITIILHCCFSRLRTFHG